MDVECRQLERPEVGYSVISTIEKERREDKTLQTTYTQNYEIRED